MMLNLDPTDFHDNIIYCGGEKRHIIDAIYSLTLILKLGHGFEVLTHSHIYGQHNTLGHVGVEEDAIVI